MQAAKKQDGIKKDEVGWSVHYLVGRSIGWTDGRSDLLVGRSNLLGGRSNLLVGRSNLFGRSVQLVGRSAQLVGRSVFGRYFFDANAVGYSVL